jgi:uncharacterized phage infection (PIP) family protein YhgE
MEFDGAIVTSLIEAMKQWITQVVVGLLGLLLLLSAGQLWLAWRRTKALASVMDATDLEELQARLVEAPGLQHLSAAVARFVDGLITLPGGGPPTRLGGASEVVRVDDLIADFHPVGRASWPSLSFSGLEHVPGWCTGLGILGTFVGVSMGLGTMASGMSEVDKTTIMPIVASLASAFWTSIFGVTLAIMVGFATRRTQDAAERTVAALVRTLESHTVPRSVENRMHDYRGPELLRELLEHPAVLIERIATNPFVVGFVENFFGRLDAMTAAVSNQLIHSQEIAEKHVVKFTRQATSHIGNVVREGFKDVVQQFDELSQGAVVLKQEVAVLTEAVSRQSQTMADSVTHLTDGLTSLKGLSVALSGLVTRNEQAVGNIDRILEGFGTRYRDLTAGADQLAAVLRELPGLVESIIASQVTLAQQFTRVQEELARHPAELQKGFRDVQSQAMRNLQALETQLTGNLRTLQREATDGLSGLARDLVASRTQLEAVMVRFEEGVAPSLENLHRTTFGLQEVTRHLRQASDGAATASETQSAAAASIERAAAHVASVQQQVAAVPQAIEAFNTHATELNAAIQALRNTPALMARSVERSIGEHVGAITSATHAVRTEVASLRKDLENSGKAS